MAWSTFAQQIRAQLGNQVNEWQAQSGRASYAVLSARDDWIGAHRETLRRFLKSLDQAQQIVSSRPEEAKSVVQKEMGYDKNSIDNAWPEHEFELTLEQLLILAMEDETRWLMSNALTDVKAVPNFLDYIDAGGLKAVDPAAVTIPGE
jgi:NitT/TauT family transport system substrate-binding protein